MLEVSIERLAVNRGDYQETLLRNAKFGLDKNQIYSIVGKNGSGKTTFIKSLTGLLNKKFYSINGRVIFEENDLLSLDYESLRLIRQNKIKYVFQDAKNSFDQLTKMKYYFDRLNVPSEEKEEALAYLLLPQLSELNFLHPYEVSGGMAQRISLALALLAHPSLIILDEPTSGVDTAIANLFLLKLKEFVKNNAASVLLVTQDLSFANMISDKIAMITNSKLTPFLPPGDFFRFSQNTLSDDLVNSYLHLTK
jgi:ABC-type glutathione transport system ATPase component